MILIIKAASIVAHLTLTLIARKGI